ncbi:MAG: alkaline phosphatase, partial [Akkermansia sp.]|nr:alkaline phosphatase [Akkermansia sp.]
PGNLPPPGKRGAVLRQATLKALETLSRNPRGFFLMVEGSNIDKAAHHGKLAEMMEEIFDFDRTAGAVLEWAARHPGTLVVITADHNTGAFSLSGGNLEKGEITALFSSGNHDGVAVPVYAFGSGSGAFTGIYENTDIFRKIMAAMKGEENKAVPVKKDS